MCYIYKYPNQWYLVSDSPKKEMIPHWEREIYKKILKIISISYQGPKIFNTLPADIRLAKTFTNSVFSFTFLSKNQWYLIFIFSVFFSFSFCFSSLSWLALSHTFKSLYFWRSHPCLYPYYILLIILETTWGGPSRISLEVCYGPPSSPV